MSSGPILLGCAGWSLGREHWPAFPEQGTHLQRYGSRLGCVEINSSFYRPHRLQTYQRWADSVPDDFRFSVKVPKQITHGLRLRECASLLDEFLSQCRGLDHKLGCLLVQLPPSLVFEEATAQDFLIALRERFAGPVALEPRHESWTRAEPLLLAQEITQVAVDPGRVSGDDDPRGARHVQYWRLHGSPRIYHDAYGQARLEPLAAQLAQAAADGAEVWCIFDNTASGAALADLLILERLLQDRHASTTAR